MLHDATAEGYTMSKPDITMHPAFGFEPEPDSPAAAEAGLEPVGIKGVWQARAALCELLILSFSYPDRPLTITVTLGEYAAAASNIAADIGIELPDGFTEFLEDYEGASDSELLKKLREEYARLFGGEASDGIVSPFESDWRGTTALGTATGAVSASDKDAINADVATFYQSCGLMATPSQSDPLDHLEAEIEFLEFVALAHIGMVDTNPNAPIGPEGYGDAYDRFIGEHASQWMSAFADAVEIETDVPFYKAAALLLKAYVSR